LWHHYYQETLIFVIDASDRERFEDSREGLHHLMSQKEFCNAAVLIYANKQDQPDAMSTEELTEKLELNLLKNKRVR
jgi:signal recognition particle receptor subunit beta